MNHKKQMNFDKKNKDSGFTLLETIVAVSILVTAIVGPFSLASQSIRAQGVAKNNLIAANLAQEGLELFRNYRANNILRNSADGGDFAIEIGIHWLDGTSECVGSVSSTGCGIDALEKVNDVSLSSCNSLNQCTLYINTNGVYGHNASGVATKFHRKITLEEISVNPPEIKITATVWWGDSLGTDSFSVSTHLLNW
jgi:prepilin-type N-terminal cleavage/methylation domain-containing protein